MTNEEIAKYIPLSDDELGKLAKEFRFPENLIQNGVARIIADRYRAKELKEAAQEVTAWYVDPLRDDNPPTKTMVRLCQAIISFDTTKVINLAKEVKS